ncbi:MAG: hypothetical protein RLZZ387_36, partial [Chloroflexota bacterium]
RRTKGLVLRFRVIETGAMPTVVDEEEDEPVPAPRARGNRRKSA